MSDVKMIPVPISMTEAEKERLDNEAKAESERLGKFVARSAIVRMSMELYFEAKMFKSLTDWAASQPEPAKE